MGRLENADTGRGALRTQSPWLVGNLKLRTGSLDDLFLIFTFGKDAII